jgi:hypothetical protein
MCNNSQINWKDSESRKSYVEERKKAFLLEYPESVNFNQKPVTKPASLENVNLSRKDVANLQLKPILVSAIFGAIMGDGSIGIAKGYVNARYQSRHSTRQEEWFFWKAIALFGGFISEKGLMISKPDGFQVKSAVFPNEVLGKYRIQTCISPILTNIHNIIVVGKEKTFQRFWLNHMDANFLMVLWLDDGSLVGQRQGIWSLEAYPKADLNLFANYLKTVWNVKCSVKAAKDRVTLTLPDPHMLEIVDLDNLERLLEIIAPLVPVKSMLYKVCLCPIDSSHLLRWTSKLKTLVRKEWHADIDDIYSAINYQKSNPIDKNLPNIGKGPGSLPFGRQQRRACSLT